MGNTNSSEEEKLKNKTCNYTAEGNHSSPKRLRKRFLIKKEKINLNISDHIIVQQIIPSSFRKTVDSGLTQIYKDNKDSSLLFENIFKSNDEDINLTCETTDKSVEIKHRPTMDYEIKYYKTADDLRMSYIAKLVYKKVWLPSNENKIHNSLIIFDWDDTLLPTTFLTPNGIFNEDVVIDQSDIDKIKKLENKVYTILKKAIDKGETYIITNAAPGWVEFSAQRFYPETLCLLKKINIISARGEYEKKIPGDSRQWKIQTFLDMSNCLDVELITNIVCIGDSLIEMEAAHILASKFSQAYIKTVKFRESPQPEELNKQLNLVINEFDKILSSIKNLTVKVDKKPKKKNS